MFQVNVRVANTQSPDRSFQEPFWVDTGALYSFAPEDRLQAIGIVPKFTRDFVFADGRKDRRLVGEAAFSIEGSEETITCLVVFGPPGSLYLLGATALENFGVQADPTTQKLRPITAVIAAASASATPSRCLSALKRSKNEGGRCELEIRVYRSRMLAS